MRFFFFKYSTKEISRGFTLWRIKDGGVILSVNLLLFAFVFVGVPKNTFKSVHAWMKSQKLKALGFK